MTTNKRKLTTKRPKKVVAAFVKAAADGIFLHDLEGALCSARRAKTKKARIDPTVGQAALLRFIWMRDITWLDSLGMNWNRLGGLFTRGLVEFRKEKDGAVYLRVTDVSLSFVSPGLATKKGA